VLTNQIMKLTKRSCFRSSTPSKLST